MAQVKVAFWNLQNLFDVTASEIAADFEFTPEQGWTQAVFNQKVANLAAIIRGLDADLLGICEIENKGVIESLLAAIGRDDYAIAHVESPDIRGIDVSLIYSQDVFELAGEPVGHVIHLRYPTRDIFEVPLRVKENGAHLDVLVNHWPSRRKGVYESEPFRLAVANHCGRLVDQILKYPRTEFLALPDTAASLALLNARWNHNILLMGDFNDEPFNRSMLEYLRASSGLDHLEEDIAGRRGGHLPAAKTYLEKQAYLFNCMWPHLGVPDAGTHYFAESTNTMNLLDQFIVSRGLLFGLSGLRIILETVEISRPPLMATRLKQRPKKFEFDKTGVKSNGYSDHFPIQAVIETL